MKLSNKTNIHLSMAVFLANDDYDYDNRPNSISATSLLQPMRKLILSQRVSAAQDIDEEIVTDLTTFIPASFGNAVHDAIENAWLRGHERALKRLGFSDDTIGRFKINPAPGDLEEDTIAVYMEQRAEKKIEGMFVTGKYDFVGDGELVDHKTTGCYSYIKKSKDADYQMQGSIYRWLNQNIITNNTMIINYTFTDWSKKDLQIQAAKGYPPSRVLSYPIPLLSIEATEAHVRKILKTLHSFRNTPEVDLPECTKEELWQRDTVYKYYLNPTKRKKSTKNFSSYAEAQTRLMKDGSTGVIVPVFGIVNRCDWCTGRPLCSQYKRLADAGLIKLEE